MSVRLLVLRVRSCIAIVPVRALLDADVVSAVAVVVVVVVAVAIVVAVQ